MAIRKISEFVSATPTSEDKILFEQNEKGKSCSIGDAVNTCSLSYEEIMASTADLSGKVANANSLKELNHIKLRGYSAIISYNETHVIKSDSRANTFIFCTYGDSGNQYSVWYVTNSAHKILGDAIQPTITVGGDRTITIHSDVSWNVYYSVIGDVRRIS